MASRPDAAFPGLAVHDTRDRVKEMVGELEAEAARKAAAGAAALPSPPRGGGRERDREGRGGREGERRRRSRSRSCSRSRDRYRRRGRSRSRSRERGGRRGSPGGRNPPPPPPPKERLPDKPALYGCYRGRVSGIMEFGAFVELIGFSGKAEGLVHLSNMAVTRPSSAKDIVSRNQEVWIKVVSTAGARLSLSMRDVDQKTGEDLVPISAHNPTKPGGGLRGLSGVKATEEDRDIDSRRSRKRLTSPERWEVKQLIASGVLKPEDYPDFDDETGQGVLHTDLEAEQEFEIDINEDEPLFLKGQSSKTGVEVLHGALGPARRSLYRPPCMYH